MITHLQGWRRPTDAQDNTLEVCAKTQGERHCQKFLSPAARRGDKLAALAKHIFFRLAALAGPYFIEFDEIDSLIRILGRAPLINTSSSWSALQNFRAESLG